MAGKVHKMGEMIEYDRILVRSRLYSGNSNIAIVKSTAVNNIQRRSSAYFITLLLLPLCAEVKIIIMSQLPEVPFPRPARPS